MIKFLLPVSLIFFFGCAHSVQPRIAENEIPKPESRPLPEKKVAQIKYLCERITTLTERPPEYYEQCVSRNITNNQEKQDQDDLLAWEHKKRWSKPMSYYDPIPHYAPIPHYEIPTIQMQPHRDYRNYPSLHCTTYEFLGTIKTDCY